MIAKTIPHYDIRAVLNKEAYLVDPNHPRHRDEIIEPLQLFGAFAGGDSIEVVVKRRAEEIARLNRLIRPGPKIKVLGFEGITRNAPVTSPGMVVTRDEALWLPHRLYEILGFDMIVGTHRHRTGDADWHAVMVDEFPRTPSVGSMFRKAIQTAFTEMNANRRLHGRPELKRVEDRRMTKLLSCGVPPLPMQLALEGVTSLEAVPEALSRLSHCLGDGGIDLERNRIYVIHPGKPDTTYAYDLKRLLIDVSRALDELADESSAAGKLMVKELDEEIPGVDL